MPLFYRKVDVDINGMMDPATRPKEGELSPGRRPGPKVNLLKELEVVVTLAKRPIQSTSPSFSKSPTVPGGLYNLWEPMACNVKHHSNGWPSYTNTKFEPIHFPNEVNNHFRSPVHSSPSSPYDPKGILEAYPNQWATWQSNQEPIKPTIFEHCPPMRSYPYSNGFQKPPGHAPSVPDKSSSPSWPGSKFDYGFIGGPAVDLISGAVISPRRHQRNSSPISSETSIPRSSWKRLSERSSSWFKIKKGGVEIFLVLVFSSLVLFFLHLDANVWLTWTGFYVYVFNQFISFFLSLIYLLATVFLSKGVDELHEAELLRHPSNSIWYVDSNCTFYVWDACKKHILGKCLAWKENCFGFVVFVLMVNLIIRVSDWHRTLMGQLVGAGVERKAEDGEQRHPHLSDHHRF
jgi:hypothetical protein